MRQAIIALILVVTMLVIPPAHAAGSACTEAVTNDAQCNVVEVFGHRGQGGNNENTLPAFQQDEAVGSGFESDGWVLKDGTPVIFHDERFCRVVDKATLPRGVDCNTLITDVNLTQFRQMRTLGGQPLVTVKRLIRFAGRHHVPGMIENKVRPDYSGLPAALVAGWIHKYNAQVSIYQTPKPDGKDVKTPEFVNYGVPVGAKYLGDFHPSPADMAAAGYSFVIGPTAMFTTAYNNEAHEAGIKTGNYDSGQSEVWTQLVSTGADYILAPHPGRAERWLHGN